MDWAHEWTDEQIEALERRFDRAYSQAAREMREKLDTFLSDYARRNAQWMRDIHDSKATSEEWDAWKRDMATDRQFISGMVEQLSRDATRTNQLAFDMINDALPSVAAENANFAAYGIESRIGYDTHSFDLVDQSTIRRMMGLGDDGQILHEVIPQGETPNVPWQSVRVDMDTAKDVRWNRQKFNALLTQSILQGESIPNTAKRLGTALNMGKNMATRAARTAMTAAENAGRTDSYQRAKRIGIDLEQQWMATLDMRTRHSHRQLDGQHVPVGEKFKIDGVELEFPGDPTAPGEYVWNCRCTLVAWFPDIENEGPKRFSRLPKNMTYEDWKSGKRDEQNNSSAIEASTVEQKLFDDGRREVADSLSDDLKGLAEAYRRKDYAGLGGIQNDIDQFLARDVDDYIMDRIKERWGSTFGMGMELGEDAYNTVTRDLEGRRDFAVRMGWLTQHDVDALEMMQHYTGTRWYEHVNGALRSGDSGALADTVDRTVSAIDRLIETSNGLSQTTEFIRYYRDVPEGIAAVVRGEFDTFHEPAFMSCTAASDHIFGNDANVVAHVIVPQGSGKGIYAEAFESVLPSHYDMLDDIRPDSEKEFIIRRDSDFDVVKTRVEEDGRSHIWLRLKG